MTPDSSLESLRWLRSWRDWESEGVPRDAGAAGGSGGFDLDAMRRVLAALGDPQERWPAIHVAGTKGKGSVGSLLAEAAREVGLKVGVYSSPHVLTFRERIRVDGEPIAASELEELVARHRGAIEREFGLPPPRGVGEGSGGGPLPPTPPSSRPTVFELSTALAFAHFAERQVDVAVVEVGLGGSRDATNVLSPECLAAAVVTPVATDHADALGGTPEAIARAKAGIFKEGRPAVVARQDPQGVAGRVLVEEAERVGALLDDVSALVRVSAAASHWVEPAARGPTGGRGEEGAGAPLASFCTEATLEVGSDVAERLGIPPGPIVVSLSLPGLHQAENAATALVALSRLPRAGTAGFSSEGIRRGFARARLPGRFTLASVAGDRDDGAAAAAPTPPEAARPRVVLDGAHTPESARALATELRAAFPTERVSVVVACADDKDHEAVFREIAACGPVSAQFTSVPIAGAGARSAEPGRLLGAWQRAQLAADVAPPAPGAPRRRVRTRLQVQSSLAAAFDRARVEAGAGGVVVVTGSLHAVGAALASPLLGLEVAE